MFNPDEIEQVLPYFEDMTQDRADAFAEHGHSPERFYHVCAVDAKAKLVRETKYERFIGDKGMIEFRKGFHIDLLVRHVVAYKGIKV